MLQSLLAVDSPLGIVHEELLSVNNSSNPNRKQIQSERVHSRDKLIEWLGRVHGRVSVPLRVRVQSRHRRQRGGPQLLEDDLALIGLILPGEQRRAVIELYR